MFCLPSCYTMFFNSSHWCLSNPGTFGFQEYNYFNGSFLVAYFSSSFSYLKVQLSMLWGELCSEKAIHPCNPCFCSFKHPTEITCLCMKKSITLERWTVEAMMLLCSGQQSFTCWLTTVVFYWCWNNTQTRLHWKLACAHLRGLGLLWCLETLVNWKDPRFLFCLIDAAGGCWCCAWMMCWLGGEIFFRDSPQSVF